MQLAFNFFVRLFCFNILTAVSVSMSRSCWYRSFCVHRQSHELLNLPQLSIFIDNSQSLTHRKIDASLNGCVSAARWRLKETIKNKNKNENKNKR